MKTSLYFMMTLLLMISTGQAYSQDFYKAPVTHADFGPRSEFVKDRFHGGTVSIDLAKDEVTLDLILGPECPSGLFCAAVMKQWKVILTLKTAYTDACGVKVYRAISPLGNMRTSFQELIIRDYSAIHCGQSPKKAQTQLSYRKMTLSPGGVDQVLAEVSHFWAEELRLSF